jgi:hypothetical protein
MDFDQTEIQVEYTEIKPEKTKSSKKKFHDRVNISKGDSSSSSLSSTKSTTSGRKKDSSKKKQNGKKEIKKASKASSRLHVAFEKEDDGPIFLITFKNRKQKEEYLNEEKVTVLLECKKRCVRKPKSKHSDDNGESLTGWETDIVHDDDETYMFQHGKVRNNDSQSSMLTESTVSYTSRGLFESWNSLNNDSFGSFSSLVPCNQTDLTLERETEDVKDEESIYASLGGSVPSSSASSGTSDTDNLDESFHFEDLLCMKKVDVKKKSNRIVPSCSMNFSRIDELIEKFEQKSGREEWIHPLHRDEILHQKRKCTVVTKKEYIQKNNNFDDLVKKFEQDKSILRTKNKYIDDEEEEWIHPLYRSMYF